MSNYVDLHYISKQAEILIATNTAECIECEEDFAHGDNMHTTHSWDNAVAAGICEDCDLKDNLTKYML